jgi:hypothetical protein
MPFALITTIGAVDANSYVSLAEASAYFEARLNGEGWFDAPDLRQTQALLEAAERLDQVNWLGAKVGAIQALAWPRIGVAKRDGADVYTYAWAGSWPVSYGEQYRTDEIPKVVKNAQCELAFAYLGDFNDGDEAEVRSFSDDKMSVTFDQPKQHGELPAKVSRLIDGLISPNRLMRGG